MVFAKIREGKVEPTLFQSDLPDISIISWVNDYDKWNNILLSYLSPIWGFQKGDAEVEFIAIGPEEGCRNMGEAYEMGRERAKSKVRCYFHQDMTVMDPSFFLKLLSLARVGRASAYGFIGSTIDTGASWMHADISDSVGLSLTNKDDGNHTSPELAPVKLVDGLGFITMPDVADMPWPTTYAGVHMIIEDMCMRLRFLGYQIWTIDSSIYHESPGTVDEQYWTNVQQFYDTWCKHMGPEAQPPAQLRAITEKYFASL